MPSRRAARATASGVAFHVLAGGSGEGAGRLARSLLPRCDYPPEGGRLACGVSGGADSLALLVLALEAGCVPVAYHVDHGIRPDSAGDVEVVERAAETIGVEVVPLRVEVAPGPNLEARARKARFSVLPPGVSTGHTADDQAETVLLNLLRGSSTAGLAGMASGPRHPILKLRRAETRAVCVEAGIEWFEDPTNAELGPLRNRVRHELLPEMNELARRDLVPILCRQAELMADDEALLDELSLELDPTSPRHLTGAPAPLARRAVRHWLRELGEDGLPPSSAAVERVLGVAAGLARACDVGRGVAVRRRRGRLVVERAGSVAVR